jgi:hypothetical protein
MVNVLPHVLLREAYAPRSPLASMQPEWREAKIFARALR